MNLSTYAINDGNLAVESSRKIVNPAVLSNVDSMRQYYRSATPFPHIVIENFLREEIAEYISGDFPSMEQMPMIFKEPMSYKGQLSDIGGRWPSFKGVFDALQSSDFREFISSVTGIENLVSDPILAGGGLHQSPKSGFLDIHVDANFHPNDKALHRRVNILIYMTPRWQSEWGGALQLWSNKDNKPDELIKNVEPLFNRAVIFSTTRTSWHGVGPVQCPEGQSRRSVALYYYTQSRPDSELYSDSSVIWMNRSSLWKRTLYPVMNAGIALLKPYSKSIRKMLGRDKTFDAAPKPDH